jgi:hypothetical protein
MIDPSIPVTFYRRSCMRGYTAKSMQKGFRGSIQKPYLIIQLSEKKRKILDGDHPPKTSSDGA